MLSFDETPRERYLTWLLLGMLLAALFVNLGSNTVLLEEARRGMIALEMQANEDYIVPTYYGELYYRKPPVFNWVVLGSFAIFGKTEFALRLVSVISLLVMMLGNFLFVRKYVDEKTAFYSSIFIALGPTILFWLSILGEIDLFYSCITFLSIIGFYHLMRTERPFLAFLTIYVLGGIGTLTKGLPSPVFVAATVGGYAIYQKAWRQFFSWQHLAGMAAFGAIVGAYFYAYAQSHGLEAYFATLWGESKGRTGAAQGGSLPLHLLRMPVLIFVDLLPAALLGLLLFKKGRLRLLWDDPLNRFCMAIYGFNILPYMLSPGTKMTYLVMLHPLLLIVLVRTWFRFGEGREGPDKVARIAVPVLIGLLTVGPLVCLWVPDMLAVPGLGWFVAGTVALGLLLAGIYGRWGGASIKWLAIVMLAGRLSFDLLVLPARDVTGVHTRLARHGTTIAARSQGKPLYLWGQHDEHTFSHMLGFYIVRDRQLTLPMSSVKDCDSYFIALQQYVNPAEIEIVYEFDNPPHFLYLFRFKNCP